MKYIAIDTKAKNSRPRTRETFDEMLVYPDFEQLFIFSKDVKNTVNVSDGIIFYENNSKEPTPFIIPDKYKLVDCRQERVYNTSTKFIYIFCFYDYASQTIREIKSKESDPITDKRFFIDALDYAIKEIFFVSKFCSWEEYCEHKILTDEHEKLKKENERLKIENEQLKLKIPIAI